jgi:hypothetical protein
MRLDKFTTKFQQALGDAQSLALGNDQQFIEPQHLLLALLGQEDGGTGSLLARAGVKPGDRRFRKATGAVRAAAWLAGADEVQPGHLLVCQHVLWDDPAEGPAKAAEIVTKNADPAGAEIGELLLQADGVVASPLPKGDTREAVKRATQLQDIKARLSELVGPRAKTAAAHVAEQIKDLHRQSLKV